MDSNDRQLLSLLSNDARMTNVALARKLNVSEGAVRNRISSLKRKGIISGFTTVANVGIQGIVTIRSDIKTPTANLVATLKDIGAYRISEVSGDYDVICEIGAETPVELNELIESIRTMKGAEDVHLFTVLKQN